MRTLLTLVVAAFGGSCLVGRGRSEARQGPADAQGRRRASAAEGDQVADRDGGEGVREGQGVRGRVLGHLVRAVRRHDAAPGRHPGRTRAEGRDGHRVHRQGRGQHPREGQPVRREAGRQARVHDRLRRRPGHLRRLHEGGRTERHPVFVRDRQGRQDRLHRPPAVPGRGAAEGARRHLGPGEGDGRTGGRGQVVGRHLRGDQQARRSGEAAGRVGGVLRQVAATGGRPVHDARSTRRYWWRPSGSPRPGSWPSRWRRRRASGTTSRHSVPWPMR